MNKFILAKAVLKWSLFCFLFFILNGCLDNAVYEKNIPTDNLLWDRKQIPHFNIHIDNTNQNFELYLNLRHTSKYKYSNISLIIEEESPKNQVKRYRVELQLADSDGRWKGIGAGRILSSQVPFLNNHHFADTGIYTFKIKQNMPVNPLPEIVDVGIKVINGKVIASTAK